MQRHITLTALVWLAFGTVVAGEANSTSYLLRQDSVDGGGTKSTSASYILDASASQASVIGTSSSPRFVLQSGFWSFVGSSLVPVLLTVNRNAADLTRIDLLWSGNNPPYEVFESGDCGNVFASPLTTTSNNSVVNVVPPAFDLVCYSVLATSPGPTPPPAP